MNFRCNGGKTNFCKRNFTIDLLYPEYVITNDFSACTLRETRTDNEVSAVVRGFVFLVYCSIHSKMLNHWSLWRILWLVMESSIFLTWYAIVIMTTLISASLAVCVCLCVSVLWRTAFSTYDDRSKFNYPRLFHTPTRARTRKTTIMRLFVCRLLYIYPPVPTRIDHPL